MNPSSRRGSVMRVPISLAVALFSCLGGVSQADDAQVLTTGRQHLGKVGQWEWAHFDGVPVDAESLEVRFASKANASEQTLRVWQRDVKLTWTIKLNDRKLGTLESFEAAMESLYAIPPGVLREGENVLRIEAPNALDDIEVGPIAIVPASISAMLKESQIEVTVIDEDSKREIPCRITLTKPDGTLQPLRAEPAGDLATRIGVVYARAGKATLSLPQGDYLLTAGRGFEWGTNTTRISLRPGESKHVALSLSREVSTKGWIAADSHIHTLTHSGHGDARLEERMITIAGEGIELAIATDHNHHADYAPVQKSLGLQDRFTSVIGNEVTTKRGHFNAFPIQPGAPVVDHREEDWSKLLPAIRSTPGVEVITLNHPRDLHSGFIPLGAAHFHPKTGQHRDADALKHVDAIEVVTSGALQSDIHQLIRDWFALLNRGHRIAAIGSSDTHDVSRFILGQGRTYVAANDSDPAHLDLEEVWRSYQESRLLVSMGLLAQVRVNDRFAVGDLATELGSHLDVQALVSGPSWAKADHVALYANGILLREMEIDDPGTAGEKASIRWRIPRPAHDVHLVVIATGPGVQSPHWALPRPWQPTSKSIASRVIGLTNPVWIDADGDGAFQSANTYASRLLEQFGEDREGLAKELERFDSSVATQVESLRSTGR